MADQFYVLLNLFGYGHPLHPVLVHLVIGPVIAMALFALVALVFRKEGLWQSARQLNVLALVMWFPAVTVGVIDWLHFYGGSPAMTEILGKSIGAGVLFLVLLGNILLFRRLRPDSRVHLAFYLVAAALVGFIGLLGGDIVYGSKSGTASAEVTPAGIQQTPDGYKRLVTEGYTLDWQVEGGLAHFRLAYATEGWLSVGFGREGTMKGAHIIIGYIKDGKPTVSDEFGYDTDVHAPEARVGGTSTISAVQGSLKDGVTTLSWTMPLNTGNPKDIVLTPGDSVAVILAHGTTADLSSYHGREGRLAAKITF